MMKKLSKPLSILLSMLMLLSVSFAAQAAETSDAVGDMKYSGNTYGCKWELDKVTALLTISTREGTNCMMEDYVSDNQPWAEYAEFIRVVRIEDGVKNVGDYAFFGMNTIKSVYIGKTVETIGYSAFKGCDLAKVTIPDSVEEINNYAFQNNPRMTSVTIPATVDDIGVKTFGYQDNQKIDGFTIKGETGSEAEKYAKNNGFTFVAEGENYGATGTCTWRFEPSAGVLTIDGSGAMEDYAWSDATESVNAPWWKFTSEIKSVVIGDSVTYIGSWSFGDCTNLTELTIGKQVKTIGSSAFENCGFTSVTIPDNVEKLGWYAFMKNKKLTSVTLGENLITIGNYAFNLCPFSEISLPKGIEEIGSKSIGYYGDSRVPGFTVKGYSGTVAETYAKENRLIFVDLSASVTPGGMTGDCTWAFDEESGTLTVCGSGAMADYVFDADKGATTAPWWDYTEQINQIVIGDGVTRIGDYAFSACLNAEVSLGSGVRSIGQYAFVANNLTELTLPDSVETVEGFAFYGSVNLAELNCGNHLKTIGESAFADCFLSELTLPDSVETIGDAAFYNNQMLSTLTLGNQLRSVGAQAFLRCGFDSVEFPESVTEIGDKAFGMKYNKFDDIYEKIEDFTIYGYSGTAAETYATDNGFTFVDRRPPVNPGGTTGDCTWEFDPTTGTLTIGGEGEMPKYSWSNEKMTYITPWMDYRDQIKSVVIGDGVTAIGKYAFIYQKNTTRVTIGSGVKKIGALAFLQCDLSELTIPDSVEIIGKQAFESNHHLAKVTLGSGLWNIGFYSFIDCALTEVTIPAGVTMIDEYAFGYNEDDDYKKIRVEGFTVYGYKGTAAEFYAEDNGFAFVSLGESPVTGTVGGKTGDCTWSLDLATGVLTVSGDGEMADYEWNSEYNLVDTPWVKYAGILQSVVIGDGVTAIGESAFEYCQNVTSVHLGKKVETIRESAFDYCDLTEVDIPDSVKVIGDYAFYGCGLTALTLPDSLTEIGDYAFMGCPMTEVTIPASVTKIGENALGYIEIDTGDAWVDTPIEGFTVKGYSGTAAETYANENGFAFGSLDVAVLYGDVNGDGSVTIDDATLVQKAIAELVELDDTQKKAADVNGDGDVTIDDATTIQKYVAEMIVFFPVQLLPV